MLTRRLAAITATGDLMRPHRLPLAVAGAALITAFALAACGSSPSPVGGSQTPSSPTPTEPGHTTSAGTFSAADVTFAAGTLRLHAQAQALAALAATHGASSQARQYAARMHGDDGEVAHLRSLMGQWHQTAPAPFTPGSVPPGWSGPGMMGSHDWRDMTHQYGHDFTDHWLDAMIANRTAQIVLCRTELASGTSQQARARAESILTTSQAELGRLHNLHHAQEHMGDHDSDHD